MYDILDRWTVVVTITHVNAVRRALCTRWARIGESGSAYYKQREVAGRYRREIDLIPLIVISWC
jgi:hypothetical protein